ncbi:MAG: metal ABC transporter substrate-binding protein [Pseudomonadota bacterium]
MSMRELIRSTFFACLTLLPLATASAQADQLKAVTTFTVIADMARNVAGDAAIVESVTKPGAEIHGYEPTPRDILRARDADLVLWNGLNLELWFEQFFRNLPNAQSVTLTEGIEGLAISHGTYEGKLNPHAWMSLSNAKIYVDNIANAFADADPGNEAIYRANAENYKREIAEIIAPMRDAIRALPENRRWLVTCEGAFSYLAKDYDLKELYLWPMNADQVGTPQQVRAVIDGVRDNNIPTVFCESTVNTDPAEQVARETGTAYGGVLYVDSLSEAGGPVPTYLDLLKVTSQTILNGLSESMN